MTTNAATNEDRRARAEETAGEKARQDKERRDLRHEWEAFHLHMAESHERMAADHRRKALELTLNGDGGGGRA